MSNFNVFIQLIDKVTDSGANEMPQSWGEGIDAEQYVIGCLDKFTETDWSELECSLQGKSEFWLECLILLLTRVNYPKAKDILVKIVLEGSDESALNAIEYVREFISYLTPEIRHNLEQKMAKIISHRMKKA